MFAVLGVVALVGAVLWGAVRSLQATWFVAATNALGMGVGTFVATSIYYGSVSKGWPWALVGAGLGGLGGIADDTGGMQ